MIGGHVNAGAVSSAAASCAVSRRRSFRRLESESVESRGQKRFELRDVAATPCSCQKVHSHLAHQERAPPKRPTARVTCFTGSRFIWSRFSKDRRPSVTIVALGKLPFPTGRSRPRTRCLFPRARRPESKSFYGDIIDSRVLHLPNFACATPIKHLSGHCLISEPFRDASRCPKGFPFGGA
jgi:hypothetical protein